MTTQDELEGREESLHPWRNMDKAGRPLPPKRLGILELIN